MPATVTFVVLFLLLALRVPVGFSLGLAGAAGLYVVGGLQAMLAVVGTTPLSTASIYPLITIPMFVLMAQFIIVGGYADQLFKAFDTWLGGIRGGLGIASVATGAGFGAISGSSVAAAATLAATANKAMEEKGYAPKLSTGLISVSGTLAIMIPPSNVLILYGLLTEQPIGPLLIAGIVPGLVASFALIICLELLIFHDPSKAPRQKSSASIKKKLIMLKHVGPVLFLFFCVMGFLFLGIATPVETAAMGAFAAMVLLIPTGRMSWRILRDALFGTARLTAMITMIIIGAKIFGYSLTITNVTQNIIIFISALDISRWIILICILCVYLILGCFMEQVSILVLTIPITLPIITALHFNPIWFGILVTLSAEIGLASPPVGLNVFVVSRYSGHPVQTVFRGVAPFVIMMLLVLALLVVFPDLALWLPNHMNT